MDIRSLNNRSFVDQTGRTRKVDAVNKLNKTAGAESISQTKAVDDTFVVGDTKRTDFNYATELLQNAKKNAYTNLREIKQKIETGTYDTAEVRSSVTKDLGKDLGYLESVELRDKLAVSEPQITQESTEMDPNLKEKLVSSEEVLNKVSERLISELFNL
jgi:cysteinyl-tRNA synthetase